MSRAQIRKDIEAIEAALTRLTHATTMVVIVNDPEGEELLRPYRLDLDQAQTVEIGEMAQLELPG